MRSPMFFRSLSITTLVLATFAVGGCAAPTADDATAQSAGEEIISGPGRSATDQRTPELGSDVTIVNQSKISMADALKQAGKDVVEAKFELADDGKSLSLSIYPVKNGLKMDAKRNVFQELSG